MDRRNPLCPGKTSPPPVAERPWRHRHDPAPHRGYPAIRAVAKNQRSLAVL